MYASELNFTVRDAFASGVIHISSDPYVGFLCYYGDYTHTRPHWLIHTRFIQRIDHDEDSFTDDQP